MNYEVMRKWILVYVVLFTSVISVAAQMVMSDVPSDRAIHQSFHAGLLADQVNISKEIRLLDSIASVYQLREEQELYPAFDLYNYVWTNSHVDPYGRLNMKLPDSLAIDVSKYAMPANYSRVTSSYGWRNRRMHKGIDLKVQTGDTIYAAFAGKIRVKDYDRRGYGHYIVMRHSNGFETVYGHLSKILIEEDQLVKQGEPIGLGGNTGRSTGSHLHFEVRLLGQDLNPAEIFDFNNRTVHAESYTYMSAQLKLKHRLKELTNGASIATHRIKQGDTLSAIAKHYGVSISSICRLNNMTRDTTLKLGRVLYLEEPL